MTWGLAGYMIHEKVIKAAYSIIMSRTVCGLTIAEMHDQKQLVFVGPSEGRAGEKGGEGGGGREAGRGEEGREGRRQEGREGGRKGGRKGAILQPEQTPACW